MCPPHPLYAPGCMSGPRAGTAQRAGAAGLVRPRGVVLRHPPHPARPAVPRWSRTAGPSALRSTTPSHGGRSWCQHGPLRSGQGHGATFKLTVKSRSDDLGSRTVARQGVPELGRWSGWRDSNSRPPAPKAGALTKLRHIPSSQPKPTLSTLRLPHGLGLRRCAHAVRLSLRLVTSAASV